MDNKFSKKEIDEFYINIGKKVKELREKNNMTQLELSYAIGYKFVSLVSSAKLYTKKKHFNLEHLYKISRVFDVNIEELVNFIYQMAFYLFDNRALIL
jgi:transcriptional regulator with XRE-family HTH domain